MNLVLLSVWSYDYCYLSVMYVTELFNANIPNARQKANVVCHFCSLNSIVLELILLKTGGLCQNRVPIEMCNFSGHKLPICDCYHSGKVSTYFRLIGKLCKNWSP